MRRNNQNTPQNPGYPQPNGYAPEGYQGGMSYQGYPAGQGYQAPQGYSQQQVYSQTTGYQQNQGYSQPQNYNQPMGYSVSRNYQTPQVTGSQPAAGAQNSSPVYTGQGSYAQPANQQQGYAQQQGGYPSTPYTQQNGYQQTGYQQANNPAGVPGYGSYTNSQPTAGSYIPQTPYSQGYTSPGYQSAGYAQGYNGYTQMGRTPQMNSQQEMGGQMPLNGGGYVPQPVPIRKRPFVLTDAYLLILSVVLLGLFALGMFVPGLGILKWVFLILTAATAALMWIKPLTDNNKRLCYTIVFGLLALVTIIGFVTAGAGSGRQDVTQTGSNSANAALTGQAEPGSLDEASVQEIAPTPSVTNTPEPNADYEVIERLRTFFSYWASNRQDDMLTLCSPTWASKEENPKTALFGLLQNRTPKNYAEESISGTSNDLSRTVTVVTTMDRNNGKDPVKYRMSIIMDKENDGLWYVNPKSLQTYENAETPDPSVTDTPAPTDTPPVYANTTLYYNPSGGEYYHLDQNCKRIAEKFLPLQGHFTYAELNDDKYKKLKPCAICGAPSRDQ